MPPPGDWSSTRPVSTMRPTPCEVPGVAHRETQRRSQRGLGRAVARSGVVVGLSVAVVLGLGACGLFSGSGSADLANAAGTVLDAPQGGASGELVPGPDQNGGATLVPVISSGGSEVYRDPMAYSTRHAVGHHVADRRRGAVGRQQRCGPHQGLS